jgi:HAMP domain-containing protein
VIGELCIALVGSAGAVVLPTETITLSWTHTVEGTPWEEDYVIRDGALALTQARVKRSGAGMDAPDGAVWAEGWWHYAPSLAPLRQVALANSPVAPGYKVCWASQCRPLNAMVAHSLFEKVKSTSGAGERDAVSNISDFLTIHRAVSLKIIDGAPISSMTISTLMAHYQQLQSYIVELATRSLESAQTIESETAKDVESFPHYLLAGSAAIILVSILLTYYFGRAISRPITNMISAMSSIAAGNFAVFVSGMQRRDEIGAMARAVDVFATVSKELREREQLLVEARALG